MRVFTVLCLSAVAIAAPQGYTYNQQQLSSTGQTGISGNIQSIDTVARTSFGSVGSSGLRQFQQQQPFIFQQQQFRQEPLISKRFYLHSAPEENDEEYSEKHITVGVPKKNYNVVFIKAPTKSTKKTAIKITPAVNEDKTVIYLLSKKTDAADIHAEVQEVASTTSKPEVFFIKYKTPEEAAHAQEEIRAKYDYLGGSSQITDEGFAPVSSVIGSLSNTNGNVEYHRDQSGNIGPVQQLGNVDTAYLPPNH